MEFNKINNLLRPAHDKVPRFIINLEVLIIQANQ